MTALNSAAPVEPGSADGSLRSAVNVSRNFKVKAYDRALYDWYVEPRWCVEQLADAVDFEAGTVIWDPCCGGGTIVVAFQAKGYVAAGSDIVDRGCSRFLGVHDALSESYPIEIFGSSNVSAVVNPPFKIAEQIVRHLLSKPLRRVAVLQQLSFLASAARHRLFTEFPPSDVLILSRRPSMPPSCAQRRLRDGQYRRTLRGIRGAVLDLATDSCGERRPVDRDRIARAANHCRAEPPVSARTPWQLYFITDARRRYVKIGLSRDAARRLNDLQAGSPLRLRIDLMLHDCDRRDEERLHHAYACHWRHREWFDYPTELKVRVDAALIAGEWSWEGIPARRSAYDSSFGGFLSRYDMLAAIKAEPGI